MKYYDVITKKKADDFKELPLYKKGYDSYFTEIPKPKELIRKNEKGLARYLHALPIDTIPISLGEGNTPLIESKAYKNVYIKNEGHNPTGNFKDRESVVALAYALENNYKRMSIVSSGNAALSMALYSRILKIETTCYVPKKTPSPKLLMLELFGAQIHVYGETYEDSFHYLLENTPKDTLNITSGVLPIRSDGSKTIAYEIWEDLGKAPDTVICPVGNGSLLAAIFHGFKDLYEWGYTDKIPKMVSVQIKGGDPVNQAFKQKEWYKILKTIPDSECEAIVAGESFCSPKALYALQQSGGYGISVTDDQVLDGLNYAINTEGIFPEFSSASVFAALRHDESTILDDENNCTVLINTATGLKETQFLREKLKNYNNI